MNSGVSDSAMFVDAQCNVKRLRHQSHVDGDSRPISVSLRTSAESSALTPRLIPPLLMKPQRKEPRFSQRTQSDYRVNAKLIVSAAACCLNACWVAPTR